MRHPQIIYNIMKSGQIDLLKIENNCGADKIYWESKEQYLEHTYSSVRTKLIILCTKI